VAAKRQQRLPPDAGSLEGPERQCAVTREVAGADALIRFVLSPTGAIVPDLEKRLPGRGVWVTARRDIVAKAVASKAFARSLKEPVDVPPDLADRVDGLLLRRFMDTLSLANKAGQVVAGFQQVDAALEKGTVAILLHGSDAALDGRRKLGRKFKAIQASSGRPAPVAETLSIDEISLAIGRPSVVHAALTPGGLAERFLRDWERLSRYRASSESAFQSFDETKTKAETDIE